MALGTLSIDGLISNLKTSELIAKLMQIERKPIQILQLRQQDLQKQSATWSDITARLLALKGMVSPLTTVPTFQVKSAVSSDTGIITASAASYAQESTYTVRVQQLALAHSVGTDSHLTSESSNSLETMLINEGIPNASDLTSLEIISITVGSTTKSITMDATSDDISDLLADINTQAGSLVTATMINDSPTTQRLVLTSKTAGRAGEIYFTDSANGLLQKLGLLDNGTATTGTAYTNDFAGAGDGHGTGAPDPAGFFESGGVWEIESNVYDQSSAANPAIARLDGAGTFTNLEASVTINMQDDLAADEADLMFRIDDAFSSGYTVIITGDESPGGLGKWNLELWRFGPNAQLAKYDYQFQNNTNYKITARAEGRDIKVFLNDVQVISYTDTLATAPTSGKVALRTIQAHSHFDNLEIKRISTKNVLQKAQDAVFTLNNVPVVSTSNTNTTAINGVTLDLVSADPNKDVNITVSSNTASVEASIQGFVTQYNSVVNFFRQQTQFEEGQTTVGTLFGNGLLLNLQHQLQNLMVSNVNPLLRTEFAGIGDGNLGQNFGDFTLKNELTQPYDVKKALVGTTEYFVRSEGGAVAGGGNQVEVRLNGQLRFFDNTGAAVSLANGAIVNVTYKPAEKPVGTGGAVSGDYNLAKEITANLSNVERIIADPAGADPLTSFTVVGENILFPGGTTTLPDGFYAEVRTVSGGDNGALRFLQVSAGGTVISAINVDDDTVRALYRGASDYGSLAQIGVTVNDITDPTLKIDSSVLSSALSSNLQSVQELFNEYTQSVATALNDFLDQQTKTDGMLEDVKQGIEDEISSIQKTINFKEEILLKRQERLQKQFASMEAALGLLQAQSVWLQQQISKLPSSYSQSPITQVGG